MKRKFAATAVFFVFAIAAVVYGLFSYNHSLQSDLNDFACETLTEVAEQQKFNFTSKLASDCNAVKNLAHAVGTLPNDRAAALEALQAYVENSNFEYLTVSDMSGNGLVSSGDAVSLADTAHFSAAMNGETVIGNPMQSHIRDALVIPIATPVYVDGVITGVLVGSYTNAKLGELFLPSFDGKGFVYVTDKDGNLIVRPDNTHALLANRYMETNLRDGLDRVTFLPGYGSKEELATDLVNGVANYRKISIDGVNEFVHYAPVGINGWEIFVVAPESYIAASADAISQRAAVLAFIIVMIFALFIGHTLTIQRRTDRAKERYTRELERFAYYDEVTGLPNLAKFKLDAQETLTQNPQTRFIIAKLDILNFKIINEMFGFDTGDQVVVAVAEQIARVRELKGLSTGGVTRVNADEFMLLDLSDSNMEAIVKRTELFEEEFNKQMSAMLGTHRVEFRYGGYILDLGETDINSAIEKANIAHRIAKSKKSSMICFYDDDYKRRILWETEIGNKMDAALARQEFQVYLQPKYDLQAETIVGAEALARWQMQDGKLILPSEFVPLFERNGFIVKLDMYMFERVCAIIRGWLDAGQPVVTVSVNFSRLHLANEHFVAELEKITNRYDLPKKYIEIELSESTIFDNEEVLEKLLNNLHNIGFTLSMDDFGMGYSSLGLLKNLPVDVVKIDRSFFINNKYKSRARAVIESVMFMAKRLQIGTVAEGVETQEHIDLLRAVGCDMVQGYYYAKPQPASEFHDDKHRFLPQARPAEDSLFDLALLGNLELGRGSLGAEMPVSVYRLFQFTIREVLDRKYGDGEMFEVFRTAGEMAGRAYAHQQLDLSLPFDDFVTQLRDCLQQSKIGVLAVESIDPVTNTMVLTVQDDLDCSGTPNLGNTLCQYDEGFIAGILYAYTKKEYAVLEVDCWGTGADVCRFHVSPK